MATVSVCYVCYFKDVSTVDVVVMCRSCFSITCKNDQRMCCLIVSKPKRSG